MTNKAIIKVSEDGYIPDSVDVRAQISPRIFTADIKDAQALQEDPKVVFVSAPKKLHAA